MSNLMRYIVPMERDIDEKDDQDNQAPQLLQEQAKNNQQANEQKKVSHEPQENNAQDKDGSESMSDSSLSSKN